MVIFRVNACWQMYLPLAVKIKIPKNTYQILRDRHHHLHNFVFLGFISVLNIQG